MCAARCDNSLSLFVFHTHIYISHTQTHTYTQFIFCIIFRQKLFLFASIKSFHLTPRSRLLVPFSRVIRCKSLYQLFRSHKHSYRRIIYIYIYCTSYTLACTCAHTHYSYVYMYICLCNIRIVRLVLTDLVAAKFFVVNQ